MSPHVTCMSNMCCLLEHVIFDIYHVHVSLFLHVLLFYIHDDDNGGGPFSQKTFFSMTKTTSRFLILVSLRSSNQDRHCQVDVLHAWFCLLLLVFFFFFFATTQAVSTASHKRVKMLGSPIIIHAFAGYILPSTVVNTTKIVLGRTLVIYTYVCVPCMYSCTYSILYMYAYAHACKMSALLVCTCTCACMILCSGPYIYIYVHPAVSDMLARF